MFKLSILLGILSFAFSTGIESNNSTCFTNNYTCPLNYNINLQNMTPIPYVDPYEKIPKTKTKLRFKKVNTVSSFTYSSCGDSNDIAQNVVLNVDPQLPQTNYILYLNADLSTYVTDGTSVYDINMNGIPFAPTTNNLCTDISSSNITCPILEGHLASESKGTIPSGVSGKIVIKNQWYNTDNKRILCMQFVIKI